MAATPWQVAVSGLPSDPCPVRPLHQRLPGERERWERVRQTLECPTFLGAAERLTEPE